jgi:RNA polymerase sigma-70 factor (ECF subfamily)
VEIIGDIDRRVSALVERGRAAWPSLAVAPALVREHLASKLHDDGDDDALHAEDLYLACACAAGDAAALAAFDETYLSQVKVFLGRMKPSAALVDEVTQALRIRLLVAAPGEVPRIANYGGRGSLTSWVRVAAIRIALDLVKPTPERPATVDDDQQPILDHLRSDDPELDVVKERYRDEVNAALRDGFAALSPTQRNLLRLSYRDGRSIDELGALFSVHRATVARWIAEAREAILDEARRRLEARLGVSSSELQSLIRVVRSQLHLSVSRLLETP